MRRFQEQEPPMISKSILAAALVSASAVAVLPLTANAAEADGSRVSRNWNGERNKPAQATVASRPSTGASTGTSTGTKSPRTRPTTNTPPRATTAVRGSDRDDDDTSYRGHRGGIDAAEAARIRRAHAESDGHVYMRRDRDHDGMTSYHSRYSSTYRGDWQEPRPRRRHWWHVWR
jgi:hypothetical protein